MPRCGIVILAAGGASRMGSAKQLLQFEGKTLLDRCVQTAQASSCRPILVVVGARREELAARLASLPVEVLINPDWQTGIGSSIRVGVKAVAAVQPACDAVALVLCDQPLVTAAHINRLVEGCFQSGKAICAAAYSGTLGTPAVFAAGLFGELLSLPDHQGGKAVIGRHAAEVMAVDLPEAVIDIDTEADFKRLTTPPPPAIQ